MAGATKCGVLMACGLLGLWPLIQDSGNGLGAVPASGSQPRAVRQQEDGHVAAGWGHQGAESGPATLAGQNGYALLFDGVDDRVTLPDRNIGALTMEAWVRLSDGEGRRIILGRENDISLAVDEEGRAMFELELGAGNWVLLVGQQRLATGRWYHTAASWDGATMRLYVDGAQVGQRSATGTIFRDVCTRAWMMGASLDCRRNVLWQMAGAIDEVRLWGSARSAQQIRQFANRSLDGPEPGLIGYWRLDEGAGQSVGDTSDSAQDGHLGASGARDAADPEWIASTVPPNAPGEVCMLEGFGTSGGAALRQDSGSWAQLPYGGTDYTYEGETLFLPFRWKGGGRDTIANWGCYLTSAAMAVNYYAQRQGKQGRTDPAKLNDWLQHHGGYRSGVPIPAPPSRPEYVDTAFVNPYKVAEYARSELAVDMSCIAPDSKEGPESDAAFAARMRGTLSDQLCSGNPVIFGVTTSYGNHYVAGSGYQVDGRGDNYRIHDPLADAAGWLGDRYQGRYRQVIRLSGDVSRRALSISAGPGVELVLMDPTGRRTGMDAESGANLRQIPGSSYGPQSLSSADSSGRAMSQNVVEVVGAPLGHYELQVAADTGGSFYLEAFAVASDGVGSSRTLKGYAPTGEVYRVDMDYSGEPGDPIDIYYVFVLRPTKSKLYLPRVQRTRGATPHAQIDGMELVYVPAGEFRLGSTEGDAGAWEDDRPQHVVSRLILD